MIFLLALYNFALSYSLKKKEPRFRMFNQTTKFSRALPISSIKIWDISAKGWFRNLFSTYTQNPNLELNNTWCGTPWYCGTHWYFFVFYNPTKANVSKKLQKKFNKPVLLAEVNGKLCPGINILHPVLVPVLGIKERGQPTEQLHLPGNLQTD